MREPAPAADEPGASNQVNLVATITELQQLRYTPAGVPVLDLVIEHQAHALEAGRLRRVELEMAAVAMGDVARMLVVRPLGARLRLQGFLAPSRKGSSRLRLHIQQFAPDN